MTAKRKVEVEISDVESPEKTIGRLRGAGIRAKLKPDPEELRRRILERWRRTGIVAKPGDLQGVSLEEEFQ